MHKAADAQDVIYKSVAKLEVWSLCCLDSQASFVPLNQGLSKITPRTSVVTASKTVFFQIILKSTPRHHRGHSFMRGHCDYIYENSKISFESRINSVTF